MGSYYEEEKQMCSEGQKRQITNSGDSFVVDVPRLSQLTEKDIVNPNSRLISRKLSKKGSYIERKTTNTIAPSPTEKNVVTLHGGSTPDKPGPVAVGSTESSSVHLQLQLHHHVTINNGSETKPVGKRLGSRRLWSNDPRRIFLFFATLSSMGTIMLIYFTLTIRKLNENDNDMN